MATSSILSRSSLNISSINKSISSLGKGISQSQKSANKINQNLFNKIKLKRQSISQDRISFQKRREAVRRKEQEDIVEASGVGGAIKRQGKVIASSTRGFLGRILDFVGTVLAGWLLQNLPIIIRFSEELIKKIQKLVGVLGGFISGMTEIFSGFGSLLSGSLSNLMKFDFSSQSELIKNSMDQMGFGFKQIEKSIDSAISILKEPMDLSIGTEEETGTGEGGTYEPPGGPETTGGGKILSPQAGYSYLRQLGVPHAHALGILANIKGESGFRIDSKQPDGPGVGLFQYSSAGRKQAFLQNVPDWKTNWKGQIKYAIGEGAGPSYLKTPFLSPEEAAEWWMNEWERPAASVKSGRRKKHNDFIRSFKPGGTEKPATPAPPAPVNQSKRYSTGQSVQGVGVITSQRGRRVDPVTGRSGAWHGGLDIGMDIGIYISCKYPATVAYAGTQSGYGNLIDVRIPSLGVMLRFAHLSRILIRSGNIPAGRPFAQSGNSGTRTTGPHVHVEAHGFNESPQQLAYGGDRDPSPYIEFIMFTRSAPKGFVAPPAPTETQNLAQISIAESGQQQMRASSLASSPDRSGPTVIIQQPPAPQSQILYGGGGGTSVNLPTEDVLNRSTTQSLLLALAYT